MKISTVRVSRVSTKRVILKKMLRKEMVRVLSKRVRKELNEDLDPKNCESIEILDLAGAVVSPNLLKFGVFNKKDDTWIAKKEKGIILFELFSGVGSEARDDEGNMYFLLKVPRRGELFVRLGEKLEIVRHLPVSVANGAANGILLEYFFEELQRDIYAKL